MDTYYTWSGAAKALNSKIDKFQPLAGPGISVEKTAGGHRISLLYSDNTPGYYGPFMLKVSNAVVTVSDGTGLLSGYAGYAAVNGSNHLVENLSANVISSGFVCLAASLDDTGENVTFEMTIQDSPVSSDDELAVYPLGYVKLDNDSDTITLIQFTHNLPQLWILGDCANSSSSDNES